MHSTILSLSTRYLAPLLIGLSLIVLYRGHNMPGGGFIGGLIAASAVLLRSLAIKWDAAKKTIPLPPTVLMSVGLMLAMASGLPALIDGDSFLTSRWLPTFTVPLLGDIKLGTPLLFDVGVYFTVIGFTLKCAIALATESDS